VPRIVIVPSPIFNLKYAIEVGRAVEAHLDVIIAIDDEWRDLIASNDDVDLMLKLKMRVLNAISGCITGVGNICPAIILHRSDVALMWLADDGTTGLLSVKEMVRRNEIIYAYSLEPPEGVKLLRLQTYKPLENAWFFDEQFENMELEVYEMLYGSSDVNRWRMLTGASTLPSIAEAVARTARRYVVEHCVSGDYNVCPGILLVDSGDRVDVKILRISAKTENYMAQVDLAGLLANR
jgi:hypothetical protein